MFSLRLQHQHILQLLVHHQPVTSGEGQPVTPHQPPLPAEKKAASHVRQRLQLIRSSVQTDGVVGSYPENTQVLLKLFLAMVLTLALPFLAFYSLHDVILPSFGVSDESMVLSAIGALVVLKICTLSYVYSALREDAQEKQANKGKEGETHESKKEHNE